MAELQIAGRSVHALRHIMAGRSVIELFGPWAGGESVRTALLDADQSFGMRPVGCKAYSTSNLESGWIRPTLPGIFTGEHNREFRQ